MDDSMFDLWRHLLTETTSGPFLELLVRARIFHRHGLAKVALIAQNTSYATKVVEKQQILIFKNFQV